jgi:hypothetical protein
MDIYNFMKIKVNNIKNNIKNNNKNNIKNNNITYNNVWNSGIFKLNRTNKYYIF